MSQPGTVLDTRGQVCPEPILRAEKCLQTLTPGSCLTVLATDPASAIDFEAYCGQAGHEWLGFEKAGRWLEIRIRK